MRSSSPPSAPRIKPLSPHLINQIAAGEVVERPASVIKELVENSIDANSTRVDILLVGGGIEEITIVDNGFGMNETDLRLCAQRHTTSKISQIEDLDAVSSFGFRGEALSSIASVARLEIRSRPPELDKANALIVQHGRTDFELRPVAAPPGTSITIRELFSELPARLKFLRAAGTEMAHCSKMVREIALGNPGIGFYLFHQGARIGEWIGQTREDRFRECFRAKWTPLSFREASENFEIQALLSPPDLIQEKGELLIYVNGRAVKNRVLLSAVKNGYRECLGPHHEPSGVLYLDVRKDWVDVNVHPQKLEVRILSQEKIYQWIVALIRRALGQTAPTASTLREPEILTSPPPVLEGDLNPAPTTSAPALRFLGQLSNGTMVCEDALGLTMVNAHLLHETLLFE